MAINYKGFTKVIDNEYPVIDDGAQVIINRHYVRDDESPKKYFITELTRGYCLLADSKKQFNEGRGTIYSIYDIEYYKNF